MLKAWRGMRAENRFALFLIPLYVPPLAAEPPVMEILTMADDASNIDILNTTAQTQLKSIIERIERLEEDKAAVANDLKEVYLEAKGNGFDTKVLRKVVRLRKQDKAKRLEEEALIDLYLSAIGGL